MRRPLLLSEPESEPLLLRLPLVLVGSFVGTAVMMAHLLLEMESVDEDEDKSACNAKQRHEELISVGLLTAFVIIARCKSNLGI